METEKRRRNPGEAETERKKLAKLRRHASRVHFAKLKEEKVGKNFAIQVVSGTHI